MDLPIAVGAFIGAVVGWNLDRIIGRIKGNGNVKDPPNREKTDAGDDGGKKPEEAVPLGTEH